MKKKSCLKNTNVLAPGMYKIHTDHTQARTYKLPQDSNKTNKRVSFSTGVIPTTSVSRPQLKSNPQGDRVLRSNSRRKKLEVEEHHRSVKLLKNKMSVTACNDSLNAKTVNVKSVSALCAKCVMIDKHDLCVPKSVAKPLRKTVASESIKKTRNNTLPTNKKPYLKNTNVLAPGMYKLYTDHTQARASKLPQDSKKTNKRVSFSTGVIPTTSVSRPQLKSNPLGDRVMHNNSQGKKKEVEDPRRSVKLSKNKTSVTACVPLCQILHCLLMLLQLIEIVLFIVDSGCSKHMTGNLKLLINFVDKFLGTVKFGNDQNAPIIGYGDPVQGSITIKRVYYVEGLNHNLFSVGQFCDADLEVAFRKSTCFIRDLKGNDLLTGSRGTDLYSITLQDTNSPNPICLMAKATSSQAWLWHRPSMNGKRYVLVIVDDYSRYTWTHFLRSKDETPEVLIDFLRLVQRGLQAQVRVVRTDKGTEFLNQTLLAYFAAEGIQHQTSVARTLEQNGVVERRNRAFVEAARTMLSAAKVPLFFLAEAIATACFTQNHQNSSDPAPECQTMALEHDSLSPERKCQENVSHGDKTGTTSNELDLLFSPMFDELLNGSSKVVSKSSAVSAADAPNQRQQYTTPSNNHTTPTPTIVLFIVDSGCSKHMTGNLKLLINFVEKFLGTVKFGNDQIAPILGYGDLIQGAITIKRVYYIEGLNHNLFSVGQFCDADLEVAFRKSTCFIRDLKGNDLLSGSRETDLYSITLQDTNSPNRICLVAKATSSQAWLWHRRLSHLNFDTINLLSKNDIVVGLLKVKFVKDHLCSSCELGKAKRKSFHTKITPSSKRRLQLLHMNLCGPCG
nr:integrase, catalytic region, zinc finger, CCHC-type, peptidase aspartic, catalytic [Tanacetum cinerariifolium]